MITVQEDAFPSLSPARTLNRRRACWGMILLGIFLLLIVASIAFGQHPVSPATALEALFTSADSYDHRVVREVRVPRTILGVAVAMAMAASGALMQALTRNPLADPGILGVNAGAGLGVVIAAVGFGLTAYTDYVWFAFAGAVGATLLTYIIGSRGPGGGSPLRMTLTGVALGAVLSGIGSGFSLLRPTTFAVTRFWSVGTINIQDLDLILTMLPFVVVGLACAGLLAHHLNALALGDDLAMTLGARVIPVRIGVIAAVTLLCGAATAAAGPILFIGFIIPHVARWIVGPDQRWIVAYSLLIAPSLLLTADLIGRLLLPAGFLPVGLMTIVFGAPIVILLVRRGTVSGL
ncbi:MAG: iron chelate uptake ABC transporter family permease subunit [Caldilineaceae bacterium]|nr:iron chelate uptake ABC transporter family permease subunit [Caldilineaceae bacterium]